MKIVHDEQDVCSKVAVGDLQPGQAIINGEGNICVVARDGNLVGSGKVRIIGLEGGSNYTVLSTCRYEPVDAVVTWCRKSGR